MNQLNKFVAALLGVGLIAIVALAPRHGLEAAERCYPDWSEAAAVVRREALVTAKDVQALVRSRLSAKIVRITLCESGGGFEYRLFLVEPGGGARNLTLDARNPSVR